jgi:hypothetical protein
VQVHEQGGEAGDVRAGHGGAAVEVESQAGVARRGHRGQDIHAGSHHVGLEQVAAAGEERAAGGEGSGEGAGVVKTMVAWLMVAVAPGVAS